MMGPLLRYLSENGGVDFAIRKDTTMMFIETEWLHFFDVINYLAPGFSYDHYLQAFKCKVMKGIFPSEWVERLDKLEHSCLPLKDAFYSKLRQSGNMEEEYAVCQSAQIEYHMHTFKYWFV